jgi:hypothetical protein
MGKEKMRRKIQKPDHKKAYTNAKEVMKDS